MSSDDALSEPRPDLEPPARPPFDPEAGHRAHMERAGQAEWLERAVSFAMEAPISTVQAELERRRKAAKKAYAANRKKQP